MAGQVSTWFANELLLMSFNRTTYAPAWDRFELCALLEEPVMETDETYLVEPSGLGYARLYIPFNATYWTVSGNGDVANSQAHTFAAATGTWGPIPGYALVASASAGGFSKQVALYGDIPSLPRIVATNQLQLAPGQIQFGLYASQL